MPKLTDEQIRELESGNGIYHVAQERAFAPNIADGWPGVIDAPHTPHGRLVRRDAGKGQPIR